MKLGRTACLAAALVALWAEAAAAQDGTLFTVSGSCGATPERLTLVSDTGEELFYFPSPGDPPSNDGPGTAPGSPGNRGGANAPGQGGGGD